VITWLPVMHIHAFSFRVGQGIRTGSVRCTTKMGDIFTMCSSILQFYLTLKRRYAIMENVEKNWQELMTEVFSYENLIREKQRVWADAPKNEVEPHPHLEPIESFNRSIQGLCDLLKPLENDKGIFKRTYDFFKNFSRSTENAEKLKEFASSISRAVAQITLSTLIQVQHQVVIVQGKVDQLIADGEVLMQKLDAALVQYAANSSTEDLARSISELLGRQISDVREDLLANHDELKQILTIRLDRIDDMLNSLLKKCDKPLVPAPVIVIKDPSASRFWTENFFTQISVSRGLLCQVDPCMSL
jgi:hypothetical protein